jgi:hypothetical protein
MKVTVEEVWFVMIEQLNLSSRRKSKKTISRRIVADFGFPARTVARTWNELVDSTLLPPNSHVKHILWFLAYMKTYVAYDNYCTHFKVASSTFRMWVWRMAEAVARMDHIVSCVPNYYTVVGNLCHT